MIGYKYRHSLMAAACALMMLAVPFAEATKTSKHSSSSKLKHAKTMGSKSSSSKLKNATTMGSKSSSSKVKNAKMMGSKRSSSSSKSPNGSRSSKKASGSIPAARTTTPAPTPLSPSGAAPATPSPTVDPNVRQAVLHTAEGGMITTTNPFALEARAEILRNGGTAADAMIAAQAVIGLTEFHSSGLGGGGFVVYYDTETEKLTPGCMVCGFKRSRSHLKKQRSIVKECKQ